MREPLPIACKTSAAYAEALRSGGDPVKAATQEWDGPWNFAGEDEDLEHQLGFGGVLPFDELLGEHRVRRLRAPRCGTTSLALGAGRAPMTESFDVCGPLPTGVTVLEASAGTGKTFTIAALAARYVAEGIPLEQILMVTFTRMATGELRERVRERLVSAEQGLERALAGAPPRGRRGRARCSPTGGARRWSRMRRERLARALADFDSATIATTHGFCQEVLGGLGVLGDIESDTTLRGGHQRPPRRGRRRPLPAALPPPRHPGVQPRAGDGDRAGGDREPGRADRARRRARRHDRGDARAARRRRPRASSTPASGAWA